MANMRVEVLEARYSNAQQRQVMELGLRLMLALGVAVVVLMMGSEVMAAGSGMPWEGTLTKILNSLQGPVARFAGIVAIAMTGFAFAFGEGGGFFKQGITVAFGLSVAFSAATFITELGFAGGALI